jgi:hypothetical protein
MTTKSCLSCVFCTRKMDFWFGSTPLSPQLAKWKHEQISLSALQREALESEDDSFIERELRAAKLWDDQFAQASAKEREKYKGTGFDPAMLDVLGGNKNKAVERFGLPERPKAPERDYLACYHQQWDEDEEPEIRSKRLKFLKQKSCSFFIGLTEPTAKLSLPARQIEKTLKRGSGFG